MSKPSPARPFVIWQACAQTSSRTKENRFTSTSKDILEQHPTRKGVILYPPTHDWGYMFQLPHQMARGFANKGYLYFYCTVNEITDAVIGFQQAEPFLYLAHVPLETFRIIPHLIVYIGSPWHRHVPALFENPRVIYDHYDDLQVSSR
jgi:hypothetical protein